VKSLKLNSNVGELLVFTGTATLALLPIFCSHRSSLFYGVSWLRRIEFDAEHTPGLSQGSSLQNQLLGTINPLQNYLVTRLLILSRAVVFLEFPRSGTCPSHIHVP
jgi:hypothetical protein